MVFAAKYSKIHPIHTPKKDKKVAYSRHTGPNLPLTPAFGNNRPPKCGWPSCRISHVQNRSRFRDSWPGSLSGSELGWEFHSGVSFNHFISAILFVIKPLEPIDRGNLPMVKSNLKMNGLNKSVGLVLIIGFPKARCLDHPWTIVDLIDDDDDCENDEPVDLGVPHFQTNLNQGFNFQPMNGNPQKLCLLLLVTRNMVNNFAAVGVPIAGCSRLLQHRD